MSLDNHWLLLLANLFHNFCSIFHVYEVLIGWHMPMFNLFNSPHSCGVRWDLQQFTLDCSECGGYAMERKECPICDGECNSVWERDIVAVSILDINKLARKEVYTK